MKKVVFLILILVEIFLSESISQAQDQAGLRSFDKFVEYTEEKMSIRDSNGNLQYFESVEKSDAGVYIMSHPLNKTSYALFADSNMKQSPMVNSSTIAQAVSDMFGGKGRCLNDYTYKMTDMDGYTWMLSYKSAQKLTNGNTAVHCFLVLSHLVTTGYYSTPRQSVFVQGQEIVVNSGGTYANKDTQHDYYNAIVIINGSNGTIKNVVPISTYHPSYSVVYKSIYGGFWVGLTDDSHNHLLVSQKNNCELIKYNDNGEVEWKYLPEEGVEFYDIEETKKTVILVGSTSTHGYVGYDNPAIRIFSKQSKNIIYSSYVEQRNHKYLNVTYRDGYICINRGKVYSTTTQYEREIPVNEINLGSYYDAVERKVILERVGLAGRLKPFLEQDKYGFVDSISPSKVIVPAIFDSYDYRESDGGLILVQQEGEWGFINSSGEFVIPCDFDKPKLVKNGDDESYFKHNKVYLCKKGLWGIWDRDGKQWVSPEYEEIIEQGDLNYIVVKKDGKYGILINSANSNHIVLPPDYDEIILDETRHPDLAAIVKKNEKYALFSGRSFCTPFEFDSIILSDYYIHLYNRVLVVKNGKYGIIDEVQGNVIAECEYTTLDKKVLEMTDSELNAYLKSLKKDSKPQTHNRYNIIYK